MTVTINYVVTRPEQDGVNAAAKGTIECHPSLRRYSDAGDVILPAPFRAILVDGAAILELDEPDGTTWCWEIVERCDRGKKRYVTFSGPGPLTAEDLVDLDPKSLDPLPSVPTVAETIAAESAAREAGDDALAVQLGDKADAADVYDKTASDDRFASSAQGAKADAALPAADLDSSVAAEVADPDSDTAAALTAKSVARKVHYLDVFSKFFSGLPWVSGQRSTVMTTTDSSASGTSSVVVDDPTDVKQYMTVITSEGTPQQQVHRVESVAGNTITFTLPLLYDVPSGATVWPVWGNENHLAYGAGGSQGAFVGFGYAIANATVGGEHVFQGTDPTIVWLGDSWGAGSIVGFEPAIKSRLGAGSTVVDAAVPGENLSEMLARWNTDVAPESPDYVVLEFGVNDFGDGVTEATMSEQMADAVRRTLLLGAIPVVTGMVPLASYLSGTTQRNAALKTQVGDGRSYPALSARQAVASFAQIGSVQSIVAPGYASFPAAVPDAGDVVQYASWTLTLPDGWKSASVSVRGYCQLDLTASTSEERRYEHIIRVSGAIHDSRIQTIEAAAASRTGPVFGISTTSFSITGSTAVLCQVRATSSVKTNARVLGAKLEAVLTRTS